MATITRVILRAPWFVRKVANTAYAMAKIIPVPNAIPETKPGISSQRRIRAETAPIAGSAFVIAASV